MKIDVVTSFNIPYYHRIGRYSVTSYLAYWPKDIQLTVYAEDCELEHNPQINQIPLSDVSAEYTEFMADKSINKRVKTFAKKAFSWIHAAENSDADYLLWMDADVMTKQPITKEFLAAQCNPNLLATFMGVWYDDKRDENDEPIPLDHPLFSAETCLYFFNLKHPLTKEFVARYKEYYVQRITDNLRRFYDADVWGATVMDFKDRAFFHNLNTDNYRTPLPRTYWHPYLQHLKAGLKDVDDFDTYMRSIIGDLVDKEPLMIQSTNKTQDE